MYNEVILISSLFLTYGAVLVLFWLLQEQGLYLWTVTATIAANIEVLMLVNAFGLEMTLGNILFASTFLATDIASEVYGKKTAQKAAVMGIVSCIVFLLISQSWMLYRPADTDWAAPAVREIFANTPRLMLASVLVYAAVQIFDVWLYHKWWDFTAQRFGGRQRFLWLRNNGSTLVSQLLNAVLFTWGAFLGMYGTDTLISIAVSSYAVFIATSLADTPFVYLARKISLHGRKEQSAAGSHPRT